VTRLASAAKLSLQQLGQDDLLKAALDQVLPKLMDIRAEVPDKDLRLSRLDAAIIPVLQLQREMYGGGPYEIADEARMASTARLDGTSQHLLLDLQEANLYTDVSDLLQVPYLSTAAGSHDWPVQGVLYALAKRPLLSLPVQLKRGPPVNVHFLVDPGAPTTEISAAAFSGLRCSNIPSAAKVMLAGCPNVEVHLSDPAGNCRYLHSRRQFLVAGQVHPHCEIWRG
jgi:hypothetical protein